jgi:hypothetical protein
MTPENLLRGGCAYKARTGNARLSRRPQRSYGHAVIGRGRLLGLPLFPTSFSPIGGRAGFDRDNRDFRVPRTRGRCT